MEYELQFKHDGATHGLDRLHLHPRCFAAREEMERTKVWRERKVDTLALWTDIPERIPLA